MNVEVRMPTIKELRESLGLSQMDLAVKANVGISTISRMENGRAVSRNNFERVCKELGAIPSSIEGVNVTRAYRRG